MPDTIIEEVRKVRDEYARQFHYDLHAMCAELRREQQQSGLRVVSFPKRRLQSSTITTPGESREKDPLNEISSG